MKILGIIPARYKSSRFPGKPLVKLLDKPMIIWVCELSAKALGHENVYVATDDDRIKEVVEKHNFNCIMTSPDCQTGTDRLSEVAQKIEADIYINIQGDEPTVNPNEILKVIECKKQYPENVICGMAALSDDEIPENKNLPKVIVNEKGKLIYMSRLAIPGTKKPDKKPENYYKQVCIYAFNREELIKYGKFGRKSYLENLEDIEILRFFELDILIQMIELQGGTYAVDVKEDIPIVENVLKK